MKTLSHPIDCGVAVLGISKAIMGAFWYILIYKFGENNIQLVYTDTDSFVFILIGNTYKEADVLSYIHEEPECACCFSLTVFQMVLKYHQMIIPTGHVRKTRK